MTPRLTTNYYYVTNSPLHKLDARIKLIATLIIIVAAFFAQSWFGLGAYCACVALLYLIARIPVRVAWHTAAPLLVVVGVMALFNLVFTQSGNVYLQWGILVITQGGIHAACFYGVRLVALVFAACLLILTTPTPKIIVATEQLLQPCARFGVPVHDLAVMAGIALRFIPEFALELHTVRLAQAARCAQIDRGPLRGRIRATAQLLRPLLRRVFIRSQALALAMDARCYH